MQYVFSTLVSRGLKLGVVSEIMKVTSQLLLVCV